MCHHCVNHGRDDKWYFNFENVRMVAANGNVTAAEIFAIDDIIDPRETRKALIQGLEMTMGRRKPGRERKHPIWP